MVPLIKEALVDKNSWLNDEEFVDGLAIAQSTPGILAVNTAIITGTKIAGKLGAVVAALRSRFTIIYYDSYISNKFIIC